MELDVQHDDTHAEGTMSVDPLIDSILFGAEPKNPPSSLRQIRDAIAGGVLAGDENSPRRAGMERLLTAILEDERGSDKGRKEAAECLVEMGSAQAPRAKVILALLRAKKAAARQRRRGEGPPA